MPGRFKQLTRSDWIGALVPPWQDAGKGRWLDACSKRWNFIYARYAVAKGYEYRQIDIAPEGEGVQQSDLREYDPALGSFDIVTCSDTLEHIDDTRAALAALRRYCAGRCYLHVPHGTAPEVLDVCDWWGLPNRRLDPERNEHHHEWEFGPQELALMCEAAGFQVLGCYIGMGDPAMIAHLLLVLGCEGGLA